MSFSNSYIFQLVSLESKVGVGSAHDIRIGSERGDNRVATGDARQRHGSGQGNILCEARWVFSQPADRSVADHDPELEELTSDSLATPEWIVSGDAADELADLGADAPTA
jgi:hypothetical protein